MCRVIFTFSFSAPLQRELKVIKVSFRFHIVKRQAQQAGYWQLQANLL